MGYWVRIIKIVQSGDRAVYEYGRDGNVDAHLGVVIGDEVIYPCDASGEPTSKMRFLAREKELLDRDDAISVRGFIEAAVGVDKRWLRGSEPPLDASRFFG